MKLTFLGTGTSTGVPQIGCHCEVCQSTDTRDNRLRTSALVNVEGHNILIDCGPDFRQQMLRFNSPEIDAAIITHMHYDHLGGIDDIRPYCKKGQPFPVYCRQDVAKRIPELMPYAFGEHRYPGAPVIDVRTVEEFKPFSIPNIPEPIIPLHIRHTPTLDILGFRIGPLGYVTDCKIMPEESVNSLQGVDTLVINALRHETHPSHLNLSEALDVIKLIKPRKAYLTHASHGIGLHKDLSAQLPDNVEMAYDGLTVNIY